MDNLTNTMNRNNADLSDKLERVGETSNESHEDSKGNVEKMTTVCAKTEETVTEPKSESQTEVSEGKDRVDVPPVRPLKRGRRLVPIKEETKIAPANFVDVPDYGYVGLDGSFQAPF